MNHTAATNNTASIAWLGLDAHSKNCVLGHLDDQGRELKWWKFPIQPQQLIQHLQAIPATDKRLMLEESNLARWLGQLLKPPVKQLVVAFSPDNESGFKRVVMLEHKQGYSLGFLTREFTVERGNGPEPLVAVYVPTNHLYLGDVVICRRESAFFPDLSVEEGIRVFLTGGMTLPAQIADKSTDNVTGRS